MNNTIDSTANHLLTYQSDLYTKSLSDKTVVKSQYLADKQTPLSEYLKGTLEDDQVTISADALKSLNIEKQSKSRETSETDAKQSDLLDELIEETKDKIDQARRSLEEIAGNTESAKQLRKTLQTELMLLNNQLLLLINQKAESLQQ